MNRGKRARERERARESESERKREREQERERARERESKENSRKSVRWSAVPDAPVLVYVSVKVRGAAAPKAPMTYA